MVTDQDIAEAAARRAGQYIAEQWQQPDKALEYKGAVDLVTQVDKAAESMILDALRHARPGDRILAEESGTHGTDGQRIWVIDPLDGTTNFAHGFPHFCVSIGLVNPDGADVGVIYDPITQRMFSALEGQGAFLNGIPMSVSHTTELSRSLLATGFPYDRWTHPDNNSHRFSHLLRRCQGIRRAGAAALDLAYVAAGWLDGYWEDRLKPWDCAAGILLVREAGGRVTDFAGQAAHPWSGDFIATNDMIHDALRAAVAKAPLLSETPERTTQ